ncbi:MAG: PorP/SprF family type IX secretion system membrane protein [Cyclobacteriaceae bacterium]
MRRSAFTSLKGFAKGFAIWIVLVVNSVLLFPVHAQDPTNFTQFYLNPYLLNASYAGFDGQPSISLLYRRQWMTIDGAPTITNLSLQAPINARLGVGMNITNDSKGFYNNTALLFSAAYHVPIQEHTFLRFGISAGGSWNTVDMKKLEAINDPALASVLDKSASLAGNAGISLHYKLFNFGIAMPAMFTPAYVSEDAFNVKEVKPFQALILHASNRFYFNNNKNIFEPYAVYRINTGLPAQYEIAGIMHLNHVVWVGASHKQDFGISALGGIKLKNMLAIGASYSIQKSGVDELNSPSFEVSLNYLFGQRKKGAPVYSFVNAVKVKEKTQTTAVRQALDARRKKAEEEQTKKAEAAAKLKQEQLEKQKRVDAQAQVKQQAVEKAQLESQAKLKQDAEQKQQLEQQQRLKLEEVEKQKRAEAGEAARLAEQKRLDQEKTTRESADRVKQEQAALAGKNAEAQAEQEASARRIQEEHEKLKLEEAERLKRSEAAEAARAAEQKRIGQENAIRESAERQKQEQEALAKTNAEAQAEREATARRIQEERESSEAEETKKRQLEQEALALQQRQAIAGAESVSEGQPHHEEEQLQRLVIHAQDPTRAVEDTARTGKPVRHEVVKRGNHTEELEASEYVTVGVFKSRDNGNHFSNGLRSLNFRTNLGYLTEKKLWYVYLLKTNNIERARAEQARVSKMFLLRDAFLLTVE